MIKLIVRFFSIHYMLVEGAFPLFHQWYYNFGIHSSIMKNVLHNSFELSECLTSYLGTKESKMSKFWIHYYAAFINLMILHYDSCLALQTMNHIKKEIISRNIADVKLGLQKMHIYNIANIPFKSLLNSRMKKIYYRRKCLF